MSNPLLRLDCCDAVSNVRHLVIKDFPATIGRGVDSDFPIGDCWASRLHCRIEIERGKLFVTDLDSANGTRVNNEVIDRSPLTLGDRIVVGVTTFEVASLRVPHHVHSDREWETVS